MDNYDVSWIKLSRKMVRKQHVVSREMLKAEKVSHRNLFRMLISYSKYEKLKIYSLKYKIMT